MKFKIYKYESLTSTNDKAIRFINDKKVNNIDTCLANPDIVLSCIGTIVNLLSIG